VVTPNPTSGIAPAQTGYIPTPTLVPIQTPTPTPRVPTHYVTQGETVYVNDTVDISGVVPPYPELAYWNGYDMYNSNASYIIEMPTLHSGYYNFYLDPAIFSTRTGYWYKYAGNYEPNGNNVAFIVEPQSYRNTSIVYGNGTRINISETILHKYTDMEIPITPPVEIKHVSDYLVARGDPLNIKTNDTTNVWLFGRVDQLLDFKSTNSTSIDITTDVLNGFEPGPYTVMTQTIGNKSSDFTVKYDSTTHEIKWFNSDSFEIDNINVAGLSPMVMLQKFDDVIPYTMDVFKTYKLQLQDPYIEIQSVDEQDTSNETVDEAGVTHYNTNASFIEVKGYTNVAIGSKLRFVVDESRQTPRTIAGYTTTAVAGGSKNPGDMRWFDVEIPIDKYNMVAGEGHTITAYTGLSDAGAVYTFVIYTAPAGSYVPPQTIRYIAGRNGPEEFVPTPTPIVQTVTVPVPGPTQIVIQTVTPSDAQVKAQQEIIMNDNLKTWGMRIVAGLLILGAVWYLISLFLRRRELK
jgi:hypothetical protein